MQQSDIDLDLDVLGGMISIICLIMIFDFYHFSCDLLELRVKENCNKTPAVFFALISRTQLPARVHRQVRDRTMLDRDSFVDSDA